MSVIQFFFPHTAENIIILNSGWSEEAPGRTIICLFFLFKHFFFLIWTILKNGHTLSTSPRHRFPKSGINHPGAKPLVYNSMYTYRRRRSCGTKPIGGHAVCTYVKYNITTLVLHTCDPTNISFGRIFFNDFFTYIFFLCLFFFLIVCDGREVIQALGRYHVACER